MNGWFNLYKPKGITSSKAVLLIKRYFKKYKIGHAGTLDPEAEGVLPLAIGQATKLVSILCNSSKEYLFTIQFGTKTSTGDISGEILEKTNVFPTEKDCLDICSRFIGKLEQMPPTYSAIKINGVRAYKLARQNKEFKIKSRFVSIYSLKLLAYHNVNKSASYIVNCSKGTYIRTLAEQISLSLHTLGFVIELIRTKVGMFTKENSVNIFNFDHKTYYEARSLIKSRCFSLESVLDNIPVLKVNKKVAQKIKYGQECSFNTVENYHQIWLKYYNRILAIGSLFSGKFRSLRVFSYKKMEKSNVKKCRS